MKPEPAVGWYANLRMFSDIEPYEIVRVISLKTIEVRRMKAKLKPDWKPEIIPGGFAGHCVNNHDQDYDYESDHDAVVIRARKHKDGYYHSHHGRHVIAEKPYKFHDYNF